MALAQARTRLATDLSDSACCTDERSDDRMPERAYRDLFSRWRETQPRAASVA